MVNKVFVIFFSLIIFSSVSYAEGIKIGFMTTLSGPAGIIGKQMKKNRKMKNEKCNFIITKYLKENNFYYYL